MTPGPRTLIMAKTPAARRRRIPLHGAKRDMLRILHLLRGILALGMLLAGLSGCAGASPAQAHVDSFAPDFELEDLNGARVRLSDFRGQVVVLNFWATWCPPCRVELPTLQRLEERRGDEIVLLAISQGEDKADVERFVREGGYTFRVLLDPRLIVGNTYGARSIPTTFVIDQDGVIRYKRRGMLIPGELDVTLNTLLSRK